MKVYRKDIEQLKALNDLLYDLIEKYYPEYDQDSFEQLDLVTQTFVLIVDADGQINNGGIIQFIDNGTGNRFHETIEAAERIKHDGFSDMLNRAAKQFPNEQIPKDWDYRRWVWDELMQHHTTSTPFNKIDEEAKKRVLKTINHSTSIDNLSFVEEDEWCKVWDELDAWYYANIHSIYQNLIDYLKVNATLID